MGEKFKMEEISSKTEGLESFSKKPREWSCWNLLSRLSRRKRSVAHRSLSWDFTWLGLGKTELTEPWGHKESQRDTERVTIAQPEGDKCMHS